jgi:uncharacterized SAM-binding protein YcdF (DUF218 family)
MYFISKFIWHLLTPLNFLIILIIFGFFLKILNKRMLSKIFFSFSFFFFIIVGVFPLGNFLLFKLEQNYQTLSTIPNDIDGILILGGPSSNSLTRQHDQVSFNEAGERLTEAIKIIRNFSPNKIIFSGGSYGQTFENSHAYVAKKFFSEIGIDVNNFYFEYQSRNTYENILFSKKIANPVKDEKWLIITSSFHMKRTIQVAEKLEWDLIPYPVDFRTGKYFSFKPSFVNFLENFNAYNLAAHEFVGLFSYYILGRTNKFY